MLKLKNITDPSKEDSSSIVLYGIRLTYIMTTVHGKDTLGIGIDIVKKITETKEETSMTELNAVGLPELLVKIGTKPDVPPKSLDACLEFMEWFEKNVHETGDSIIPAFNAFYHAIAEEKLTNKDFAGRISKYYNKLEAVRKDSTANLGPTITDNELLAIIMYSDMAYKYVNKALYTDEKSKYKAFIRLLDSGLKNLPQYKPNGTVTLYRGMRMEQPNWKINDPVQFCQYLSTSIVRDKAIKFSNPTDESENNNMRSVIIEITGEVIGCDISKISIKGDEKEVLLARESKFIVTEIIYPNGPNEPITIKMTATNESSAPVHF